MGMPASKKPKVAKSCIHCSKEFLSNNKRRVYCSSTCNTLYNRSLNPQKHRAYAARLMRERSPEKKAVAAKRKRDLRLGREYGISQEQYIKMYNEQGGKCYLCNKFTKLVIDHNHKNGKLRKLLCHHCNRGLGFLRDSHELLAAAAEYIKNIGN
jgi:hypothetical protein